MSRRDQIVLSDAELAQLLESERVAVVSSLGPRGWPQKSRASATSPNAV